MILANLTGVIALVLMVAAAGVGLYAFVHAALQRADAYPAVDKLTKPVWLLILGVALLLVLLLDIFGAAICAAAAGVYLVDVKPKLLEIQGKSR
ncbi:membrane protein [Mycolicibacterium chitae]|uniref:Protein of uncharacterized function (DUF2516) n=2 Tax=Mycolicibacterium chitae TaxID=1792 RepID=A0A3S5EIN1_MYCCI|nr:DUF2516 family protein [Mycolicibacterium chitae]MCV7109295.1 DUF2516 family protein [Mycolicibacterium chitae]BBZ00922.1 membrane protein [Mycolicibacterium chitae]VEG49769.1 Protein of uncharacterised function (DUF2516) [Mycolicibacterium chitae]